MADTLTVQVWQLDFAEFKSPAAKLVALAIARRSRHSGLCWAKQSTLGADCGVSKQTIARCLDELGAAAWLYREKRFDKLTGARISDMLWLTLPAVTFSTVDPSSAEHDPADVRALDRTTVKEPVTIVEGGPQSQRERPPTSETTQKDSFKESLEKQEAAPDGAGGEELVDYAAAVELIWRAASDIGRSRSSKPDIEKGLRAAISRGATMEPILRGLGAYFRTADATKDNGAFQRGAHVILAKDRWASFLEEAPNTPAIGAQAQVSTTTDARQLWGLRVELFSKGKAWDPDYGPQPGRLGCEAPADILEAYGFPTTQPADDNAGAFD